MGGTSWEVKASVVAYGAQTVGTTAVQIFGPNNNRVAASFRHAGGTTVYVGYDSGVTTANGYPVDVGEVFEADAIGGAVWGVCASGSADLRKAEG